MSTLIELLEEDSVFFAEQLSGSILSTLQLIGPDAAVAVPKLLELLEKQPMPQGATTLMKIGADPDLITPPLQRLLTNGPAGLRPEAAWVLKQLTLRSGRGALLSHERGTVGCAEKKDFVKIPRTWDSTSPARSSD